MNVRVALLLSKAEGLRVTMYQRKGHLLESQSPMANGDHRNNISIIVTESGAL